MRLRIDTTAAFNPDYQKGDRLRFYRAGPNDGGTDIDDTMENYTGARIARVDGRETGPFGTRQWVTLTGIPRSTIVSAIKPLDFVVADKFVNRDTTIVNCIFRDLVGRGIISRAPDTHIEGNTIGRTTISGLRLGPEFGVYTEAGYPSKSVIRNNNLYDIGLNSRATQSDQHLLAAINICAGTTTKTGVAWRFGLSQRGHVSGRGQCDLRIRRLGIVLARRL